MGTAKMVMETESVWGWHLKCFRDLVDTPVDLGNTALRAPVGFLGWAIWRLVMEGWMQTAGVTCR